MTNRNQGVYVTDDIRRALAHLGNVADIDGARLTAAVSALIGESLAAGHVFNTEDGGEARRTANECWEITEHGDRLTVEAIDGGCKGARANWTRVTDPHCGESYDLIDQRGDVITTVVADGDAVNYIDAGTPAIGYAGYAGSTLDAALVHMTRRQHVRNAPAAAGTGV